MKKADGYSEYIKHQADIEFFGNGVALRFKELFRAAFEEITERLKRLACISSKEKYLRLAREVEDILSRLKTESIKKIKADADNIISSEKGWLLSFMLGAGIAYSVGKSLEQNIKFMPVAGRDSYLDITPALCEKIKTGVAGVLKTAYLTKEPSGTVSERLERQYKRYENYVETELSTTSSALFRNTDRQIFRENSQQVRYSAVLDFRTCLSCASYSGILYKPSEAPVLPIHDKCRCFLVPAEIYENEISSFSQWIETLDDLDKRKYLGKGRYELYKKGVLPESFVNDGRIIPLSELTDN